MNWQTGPLVPALAGEQAHLWKLKLAQSAETVAALRCMLTDDELERADRFLLDKHRMHFVVARAALRAVLGRYLGIMPRAVPIGYGTAGKPELTGIASRLSFNLSHSQDLAVIGIAENCPLGVDIEPISRCNSLSEIAERYFSAIERKSLLALPLGSRTLASLHCWVRKEAYLKALGEGLRVPLDSFSISVDPNVPPQLLQRTGGDAITWSVHQLDVDAEYAGALVIGGNVDIICWELDMACFK